MRIYLASPITVWHRLKAEGFDIEPVYVLSSFVECLRMGSTHPYITQERHMLDSGAFSTFKDPASARGLDWDAYAKAYAEFIKATKQSLFLELDIDVVVGLKRVEEFRARINDIVGRPCIPVWHSSRGYDYFLKMCEEHPYVAISTTKATPTGRKIRSDPSVLSRIIDDAHARGAKIHGLGFTALPWLSKLKFDSIDSTAWISHGKFGAHLIIEFDAASGTFIRKHQDVPDRRVSDMTGYHARNFKEWARFARYAESNL